MLNGAPGAMVKDTKIEIKAKAFNRKDSHIKNTKKCCLNVKAIVFQARSMQPLPIRIGHIF
jgi:hypothetical protein